MVITGKNTIDTTAHFTAQRNAAMTVSKFVVFNEDIFTRDIGDSAITVSAGFQADTVIAGIKMSILDPDTGAAFGITAVVIEPMAGNGHTIDSNTFTLHRIQLPHGAVMQRHTLQ